MKNSITAQRLQEALEAAHMIPVELSQKSGVSQSSISQYLSGSHAPSNVSSGKMAAVLGCDPVWLMGFDVPRAGASPADLTAHEQEHIRKYRAIDDDGRQLVDNLTDTLYWQKEKTEDAHASAS